MGRRLGGNRFLTTPAPGWAGEWILPEGNRLKLSQFLDVLNEGPMASDVSRLKAPKIIGRDFAVEAAISNVLENTRLIAEVARGSGIASPVLDVCHALYGEALRLGLGDADMAAVLRAIELRSDLRE